MNKYNAEVKKNRNAGLLNAYYQSTGKKARSLKQAVEYFAK